MIRKARVGDSKEIQHLIGIYAKKGEMLPRSLRDIFDDLRDFSVYVDEGMDSIIGTCAMHVCWEDLAEIRSLIVREEFWRNGIGTKLVEAALSESRDLGIYRVFVLTYQTGFFEKLGFTVVDKSILPHKIWADCLQCIKFPDCDETAMMLNL